MAETKKVDNKQDGDKADMEKEKLTNEVGDSERELRERRDKLKEEEKERRKLQKEENKKKKDLEKKQEKEEKKRQKKENRDKKKKKRRCGKKMSFLGIVFCSWGTLQLTLMGVFYYTEAMALFEDLTQEVKTDDTADQFHSRVNKHFKESGICCWGAAGIYLVLLIACALRHHCNLKFEKKVRAEKEKRKLK